MQRQSLFPITVIGSFPKPSYLNIPSWFNCCEGEPDHTMFSINSYTKFIKNVDKAELKKKIDEAYVSVIKSQIDMGIDVITDGEIERENYIHYHCRHLKGFDFDNAEKVRYREGATEGILPKVIGKVEAGEPFLVDNFIRVQKLSHNPVKVTVPGPMTVKDTSNNTFYKSKEELCWDLACAINVEIKRLVDAGCEHIQVDEPLFARQVDQAYKFGFKCLDRCLDGIDLEKVHTTVHICCGYSDRVDQEDYQKAENHCYVQLADGLDKSKFHAVSIEDAHTRIPKEFFQLCKRIEFVLGCIQVVRSGCLKQEEIESRVREIIGLGVDPKRIILAPDCGLAMLKLPQVQEKMANLAAARNTLREEFSAAMEEEVMGA